MPASQGLPGGPRGTALPHPSCCPQPRLPPCLGSVPCNASESLKPLRPALPPFQGVRVSSRLTASSLSLVHGSAGRCQPRRAGHACTPLVTAGEIHEIQTARKINLSFIFMMVMQQPSAAAFALQLHLSIATRSQLPTPRWAGAVLAGGSVQPAHPLTSPWTHCLAGRIL